MGLDILAAVLTGSALAALITKIGDYVISRRNRADIQDDKDDKDMESVKKAIRYLLLDQIRQLGLSYLAEEEIDFDDRRRLSDMHDVYHNELGGNGDLDTLMHQVSHLPLKHG